MRTITLTQGASAPACCSLTSSRQGSTSAQHIGSLRSGSWQRQAAAAARQRPQSLLRPSRRLMVAASSASLGTLAACITCATGVLAPCGCTNLLAPSGVHPCSQGRGCRSQTGCITRDHPAAAQSGCSDLRCGQHIVSAGAVNCYPVHAPNDSSWPNGVSREACHPHLQISQSSGNCAAAAMSRLMR
jgi:hypothetical protein